MQSRLKDLKLELNIMVDKKNKTPDIEEDNINYIAIKEENEKILIQIKELREKLYDINVHKLNLISIKNDKYKINSLLKERVSPIFREIKECPICKSHLKEFNQEIVHLSKKRDELMSLFTIKYDNYSDIDTKIEKYIIKEKELESEILKLKRKNKNNISILNAKNNRELTNIILKKEFEISELERNLNSNLEEKNKENLVEIMNQISFLEEKLSGYDVENKIKEAEVLIGKLMSSLAKDLGFELGLGDPNFKIDLREFDVYQLFNQEKIFISSMGNGSNWLTVHLSLFLALNYYICTLGETCVIPTILLLDQPSQVYFPDVYNEDSEDVIKVTNIYSVILKYIQSTKKETGITPQIIITDHADNLKLGEGISFNSFVRARWKKENEGFISFD